VWCSPNRMKSQTIRLSQVVQARLDTALAF
jgi:hypothetical protein